MDNFAKVKNIVIDGNKTNTATNLRYRGAGMVSGNNSSRLLLDYKWENPTAYWEIMEYMFGENGIGITHLKVEMGSDINSSSGTEPAVKRFEEEVADVTRGAGYQLAADAKSINPDITLDMLWWGEPLWVTNAEDVYSARYKWYKETLDAAFDRYNIQFDYVSTTQNERSADYDWIKYLSKSLNSETDCTYDYSKIKLVAGDEVCTWNVAERMISDEELRDAADVVGSHYTSRSTKFAQDLAEKYGKELWFSEGSTSMNYSQGTYRFDGNGSGLGDLNGCLDVANRIIMMYPEGKMTLCQFQPVVSAYYDGVCYAQKQFIQACDPWSGYYFLESGFFMSLHFSQFIKKGWAFIDDACYCDAVEGGDGHALEKAVYSYSTATDVATGDYSIVITNTTNEDIQYNFTVENLKKAGESLEVWETRGPSGGDYNENYFQKIEIISPTKLDKKYSYSIKVKPFSMVTISTLKIAQYKYYNSNINNRKLLELPYSDDFQYSDYPENYLSSRGNAPRYTTDQGGAFEVVEVDGNRVLKQMITPETKANEWGYTPDPTTNFGDDRWFNYSISADARFAEEGEPSKNYLGVGLRYNSAFAGASGYWLQVYRDGSCKLWQNSTVLKDGNISDFDAESWNNLKISAVDNHINCYVNGEEVITFTAESSSICGAGRGAFYSSLNNNLFANLLITGVSDHNYITRFDNTDLLCNYFGSWEHNTMGSFKVFRRTISTGSEGAKLTIDFTGDGFALTGKNDGVCTISVKIDGRTIAENHPIPPTGLREISYSVGGFEDGKHTAEITVTKGKFNIDSLEISSACLRKECHRFF